MSVDQSSQKFKDYTLPIKERVADLMSRMELKEKLMIIIETSQANDRLGIPKYFHGNEALHGIVRPGNFTVFPQAIALGAAFDEQLIHDIADAASDEARARYFHGRGVDVPEEAYDGRYNGLLTFWSPDLNLTRDPRWGRTAETYGEDPYLAGKLGAAFVRGLQGDDPKYLKAVATPKHYTANNEEHNRFSCNAEMSEKTLREYHLVPFYMAVREGKCAAVMAAYNAINGTPCHMSHKLLTEILREEWGFDGYVVSDCSGIARIWDAHRIFCEPEDAASAALNGGIDLECGSYSPYEHFYYEFLEKQLKNGKTSLKRIDEACGRVLTARFRLGQFDPDDEVPFSKIPLSVIGCEKHAELAYRAACESITLLKNNGVLPLKATETVAVTGNNAHLCQFGDYSGTPANPPISPLDGIRAAADDKCVHARWSFITSSENYVTVDGDFLRTEDGGSGLRGKYYNNAAFLGAAKTRTDRKIEFAWREQMPDTYIDTPQYSIRWTGFLAPAVSGLYMLRLSYDGSAICEPPAITINGAGMGTQTAVELKAGEKTPITVEYRKSAENPRIVLEWIVPKSDGADVFAEECKAAAECDKVIAVIGLGTDYEREGHDKESLDIPREQTELLRRLYNVNRNLIVVLENGSPVSIPWIHENCAAVVEAWYPGEQGGRALADILYGKVNPSGRLCASFPVSADDLPAFDNYDNERGRTYMYAKKEPLYPFGFGLSYTEYSYGDIKAEKTSSAACALSFDVKNIGGMAGDEVIQLYIDSAGFENQPKFRLVRFTRVNLEAGESKEIRFDLGERDFSLINNDGRRVVLNGEYTVYAGGSAPDGRSAALGAAECVAVKVRITDANHEIAY